MNAARDRLGRPVRAYDRTYKFAHSWVETLAGILRVEKRVHR